MGALIPREIVPAIIIMPPEIIGVSE